MTGVAIIASDLPVHLLAEATGRLHDRAGCLEARFEWWHEPAVLPVRWDGALRLVRWGTKNRRDRVPQGMSLTVEQVESGILGCNRLDDVMIPANFGFHRGTWFLIHEGVRGVLLPEHPAGPLAYLLMQPASNYYRNMTGQSPFMPVFVNQTI